MPDKVNNHDQPLYDVAGDSARTVPVISYDKVTDSGKREEFATGSVRDTQEGKGRYDLIPVGPLKRLAKHYENGAKKYGDRNWEKGQPSSRYYSSAMRHLTNYMDGDRSEDHLAAVAWNAFAMMFNEETKPELNDIKAKNAPKNDWEPAKPTVRE